MNQIIFKGMAAMDQIYKFVYTNGQRFKKENIKLTYNVYIIFLVLTFLLLLFVGGPIGTLGLTIIPLYCIAACVYNHNILRKLPTFKKVFVSHFLLFGYLLITFNFMLYSMPILMKLKLDMFIMLIIAFEIVCVALGCIYTCASIKRNKIKERKKASTLAISIIPTLSGCWIIFLRRYVSTTSIETQAFILLSIMAIICCAFAFLMGETFIPMMYFMEKYNITETTLSSE